MVCVGEAANIGEDERSFAAKMVLRLKSGGDTSSLPQLAAAIEEAIFTSHSSDSGNEYRASIRDRSLVLKKDNPALVHSLLSGSMTPESFATSPAQDLRSAQQVQSDTAVEQEQLKEAMAPEDPDVLAEAKNVEETRPVGEEMSEEGPAGTVQRTEETLGEEGDYKSRAQPKVGRAMEGIEFETGGV